MKHSIFFPKRVTKLTELLNDREQIRITKQHKLKSERKKLERKNHVSGPSLMGGSCGQHSSVF